MFLYVLLLVPVLLFLKSKFSKKDNADKKEGGGKWVVKTIGLWETGLISTRVKHLLLYDLLRFILRVKRWFKTPDPIPSHPNLHLGCGKRKVPGFLNVDIKGSDCDVDLARRLPWNDKVFELVVTQHVVEHLDVLEELIPCLRDLRRCMKDNGEVWISCPDLEKVCKSYVEDKGKGMRSWWQRVADKQYKESFTNESQVVCQQRFDVMKMPTQHMTNLYFHQFTQHKNLFDFELMEWILEQSGFTTVTRVKEADLLKRCPDFPARDDDDESLYVKCVADPKWGGKLGNDDFQVLFDNPVA